MTNPASRLDKAKHPTAEQLWDEVAWMGERLEATRREIADAPLVITYMDSNGNQRTKANPAYDAYVHLFNAFQRGATALEGILQNAPADAGAIRLSLDDLRVKVGSLKAAR